MGGTEFRDYREGATVGAGKPSLDVRRVSASNWLRAAVSKREPMCLKGVRLLA